MFLAKQRSLGRQLLLGGQGCDAGRDYLSKVAGTPCYVTKRFEAPPNPYVVSKV